MSHEQSTTCFFCTNPELGVLSEEESGHANRVLRLKTGDAIQILDGHGSKFDAVITNIAGKIVHFSIQNKQESLRPKTRLHLVISPTKNIDRFLTVVEKTTEIGVAEITPVICQNSERNKLNHDKIQKAAIAAIKQSGNPFLPIINELVTLKKFLAQNDNKVGRFIAHCSPDKEKVPFGSVCGNSADCVILIGPEGDFSPEEINFAMEKGYIPVSLSENILRSETAGIVACCIALS